MPSSPKPEAPTKAAKRAPEPIGLRVVQMNDPETGAPRKVLVAASASDSARLATKGNHIGDLVFARMTKPRNPGFHRLAHAIGRMAVENLDGFDHLDPHTALKRLQLEADAGCEAVTVQIHTIWPQVISWIDEHLGRPMAVMLKVVVDEMKLGKTNIIVKTPRSLSYDSMDEIEFKQAVKMICKYMSVTYWPTMSPDQIEEMAKTTEELRK